MKRRKVAGNLSSSRFTAIKRELCNAMHFAISQMLLIISKEYGGGAVAWGEGWKERPRVAERDTVVKGMAAEY